VTIPRANRFLIPLVAAYVIQDRTAHGANILTPTDLIRAIDQQSGGPGDSGYPASESPQKAIDGTASKYLNVGAQNSGFIVTPGASVVGSFRITTANDSTERDPASWSLWGTNEAILSTNNSSGLAESWTLIGAGSIALPLNRNTQAAAVNLSNTTSYSSYRMTFPTLRNTTSVEMQIGEVQFFTGPDGTASTILSPSNPIIAIDEPLPIGPGTSRYLSNESPQKAIDGTSAKYLNFGEQYSGFVIQPSLGLSVVDGFRIMTAGDEVNRDPATYEIYGGIGSLLSTDNSEGLAETWTLIQSGAVALPSGRNTFGSLVSITGNSSAYDRYKVLFPTVKGSTNGMQIGEFELHGTPVPEPTFASLVAVGLTLITFSRRARKTRR